MVSEKEELIQKIRSLGIKLGVCLESLSLEDLKKLYASLQKMTSEQLLKPISEKET